MYLMKMHFKFWIITLVGVAWIFLKGNLYVMEAFVGGACGFILGTIKLMAYFRLAKEGIFVLSRSWSKALVSVLPVVLLFILAAIFFRKAYLTFLVFFVFVFSSIITSGIYYLERKYDEKFRIPSMSE